MAVFDYRNRATNEVQEIIYMPGEVAPQRFELDGQVWEKLFPAPRIVTADTRGFRDAPDEKALHRRGSIVREPGVDRDTDHNKKVAARAREASLEESIVATVNRAMP